jgi:glycosyltransferase involved in cell wall biosynthesis
MASHNGERYLLAQLRSLARQTLLPAELVLYDDCSSDGTRTVATRFAGEAPFPVHLIPGQPRVGPHEAFMRAVSACSSEAIAFCDQDDIWLERKLERCADALDRDGVLLAVHAASVVRHDLSPTGRRSPSVPAARVAEAGAIDPWFTYPGFAMVFRRSLLDWGDWPGRPASRYWHGAMTHDEWIGLLATSAGRTAFIPEPLALYRQHPSQLFGVARRGPRETVARLLGATPEAHQQVADLREEHARYLRALAAAICLRTDRCATAGRLEQTAAARERSAEAWHERANIYDRRIARRQRIERLVRLARDGGYRPADAGGLGRASLVRDLVFALTR